MLSITECSWKPSLCEESWLSGCNCWLPANAPYKGTAVYSWWERQEGWSQYRQNAASTLWSMHILVQDLVFLYTIFVRTLLYCIVASQKCFFFSVCNQLGWTYCRSRVAPSSRLRINFPRRAYRSVLHGCFACGEIHFPCAVFKHE